MPCAALPPCSWPSWLRPDTISRTGHSRQSTESCYSPKMYMLQPTPCPSCRYLDYIKDCVYQSPSQAQLGGVPGTFQLVRSFLHLRQLAATPGLEVCLTTAAQSSPLPPPPPSPQDGSVEGQPVWAVVFYCLRCGDLDNALDTLSRAQ